MFSSSRMMFGPMDDVHELAFIERPIRRSLKTAEEIDQLTVDEDLNDIERAVYLLSVGQEVQEPASSVTCRSSSGRIRLRRFAESSQRSGRS
ncbi:serine/threonine-protein phosphatase 4 regulatory subunit 4-like [Etheostoma spectabile]|uniref:serine/threonine-protein phosphatase 4 regulatory subunit 4-like n=1 Tax=Etheostoma spectabile TaxID=54343 RepID=UPI0013AF3BB7|nr:serine/threonine-protein phosphatase 4 regulatory subunit 4-like [Etheostoma spectabile]